MSLKLSYFDLRGRAEPARLLLHQAGVEFEDARVAAPWDELAPWVALKPTTPFGQLPLLIADGVTISQSMTIARYIAKTYGLAGRNNLENAKMDELVDAIAEVTEKQYAFQYDAMGYPTERLLASLDPSIRVSPDILTQSCLGNQVELQESERVYNTVTAPTLLTILQNKLIKNGGQFLVGGSLSWVDILLFYYTTELPDYSVLTAVPKLKAHAEKVGDLPNIKAWTETRPKTVC